MENIVPFYLIDSKNYILYILSLSNLNISKKVRKNKILLIFVSGLTEIHRQQKPKAKPQRAATLWGFILYQAFNLIPYMLFICYGFK